MPVLDQFSTTVFFDPESAGYVAICDEIPGVSAFGTTRADALREFETVLDMAVDTYRAEGWPLPAPKRPNDPALPSGEFRVRLPRYVHALLARRSEAEGVSQNTLVVALLAQGLASGPPGLTVHGPSTPSASRMRSPNTVSRVVRTPRKP
jgi:antitoxin HicB